MATTSNGYSAMATAANAVNNLASTGDLPGGSYTYHFGDLLTGNYASGIASDKEYLRNAALQLQTQEYNSAEAEKQRQYETDMSNTSYQRAAADLEAAGFNKALLVMNGGSNGASTPSGDSASSSASRVNAQNTKGLGSILAKVASLCVSAYAVGSLGASSFLKYLKYLR